MNALTKINARVKVLQKKHPKSKRTTLQKQAGREYRAVKLKPARKKKAVVKRKPVRKRAVARKKAAPRKRAVARVAAVIAYKRKPARRRKAVKRKAVRRVSGRVGKKSMLVPVLALGALAVGAYLLLKPATQPVPALVQTSNQQRNNSASNILSYAMAGGLAISAITQLINAINNAPDSKVVQAAADPSAGIQALLSGN